MSCTRRDSYLSRAGRTYIILDTYMSFHHNVFVCVSESDFRTKSMDFVYSQFGNISANVMLSIIDI